MVTSRAHRPLHGGYPGTPVIARVDCEYYAPPWRPAGLFDHWPQLKPDEGLRCEFQRIYLGEYHQLAPVETKLKQLAREYLLQTEKHDRTVCTGPIDDRGCIMPDNQEELGKCVRNAREVHERLFREARQICEELSYGAWRKLIQGQEQYPLTKEELKQVEKP